MYLCHEMEYKMHSFLHEPRFEMEMTKEKRCEKDILLTLPLQQQQKKEKRTRQNLDRIKKITWLFIRSDEVIMLV